MLTCRDCKVTYAPAECGVMDSARCYACDPDPDPKDRIEELVRVLSERAAQRDVTKPDQEE